MQRRERKVILSRRKQGLPGIIGIPTGNRVLHHAIRVLYLVVLHLSGNNPIDFDRPLLGILVPDFRDRRIKPITEGCSTKSSRSVIHNWKLLHPVSSTIEKLGSTPTTLKKEVVSDGYVADCRATGELCCRPTDVRGRNVVPRKCVHPTRLAEVSFHESL